MHLNMRTILLLAMATPMFAGWRVIEVSSNGNGGVDTTITLIQDQKLRIETGSEVTVVNIRTGDMILMLPGNQQYWKGKARTFHKELTEMMEQMKENMLKQLPEERRSQVEKMMENQKAARQKQLQDIQAGATGKSQTIAGVRAREYILKLGDQELARLWVGQPPLLKEMDNKKLSEMMHMEEGMSLSDAPAYRSLMEKGMILKEIRGGGQEFQEVLRIEPADIPASHFQVPKGYQSVSLQQLIQSMSPGPPSGKE